MNIIFRFAVVAFALSSNVAFGQSFNHDPASAMIFKEGYNGGNCVGCEWIIAEGTIQPNTPEQFQAFLKKNGRSGGTIRFNSPGGNLIAALKLGEIIRKAGLFTAVGKTVGEVSSFDPDTIRETETTSLQYSTKDGICASACVYAFIGGVTRFADKARIGIHQFYDSVAVNEPLAKTASSIDRSIDQLLTGLLLEYVIRMGVDPRLISLATTAAPWQEMRWLTESEINDLRVGNSKTSFTPLNVEAFGPSGAFVETVSRSIFYSYRHRVYCVGNANSAYVAFITNEEQKEPELLKNALADIFGRTSIILKSQKTSRSFPIKVVALEAQTSGSKSVRASIQIVGATMADVQAAEQVIINADELPRVIAGTAYFLSFDLLGDRRKIGIAAKSCLR